MSKRTAQESATYPSTQRMPKRSWSERTVRDPVELNPVDSTVYPLVTSERGKAVGYEPSSGSQLSNESTLTPYERKAWVSRRMVSSANSSVADAPRPCSS